MPTSGAHGQKAIPKAIRAMPATRATGMATPASSSPNNKRPRSEGMTINASPVTASAITATTKTFFIAPISQPFTWRRRCQWRLLLGFGVFLRFELEGQLVDLAGEPEWRIVAMFHQRDPGAGVLANVECFILRESDRDGVLDG